MDGSTSSLEISERVVSIGTKVKVKWLNDHHEGEVVDVVPQKDLYQVIESQSHCPLILHSSQMKPIDKTRSAHEKYIAGAEIAFYDNDLSEWLSGTIQMVDVEASLLIKWKRTPESKGDNLNWFIANDVIVNESFPCDDDDEQDSIKPTKSTVAVPEITLSPASVVDVLEEKPVYRANEVFNPPHQAQQNENPLEDLLPDIRDFEKKPLYSNRRRTSVSMKNFYAKKFQKVPNKKAKSSNDLQSYLENQYALLHGKLDHSALPAVWSHLHSTGKKGIPHHPSSVFFLHHTSNISRAQSTIGQLSKSSTIVSRPESEPGQYKGFRKKSKDRKMKKQLTNMSVRPLPPIPGNPYEVPLPLSTVNMTGQDDQKLPRNDASAGSGLYDEVQFLKKKSHSGILIKSASPQKQIVSAGGSITLFCEVESSVPVTFEWYKDQKKLTHNDEQVAFPEPGRLQLYGLNLQSTGVYKCQIFTAKMSESIEFILRVEEDAVHKSFSKEVGSHRLALEENQNEEDATAQSLNLDEMETNLSHLSFDTNPFNTSKSFLKSPSLMDLTRELLNKDVQRLEEGQKISQATKGKKKSKSNQTSKSTIDERLTRKEKRRRNSKVIKDLDSYLYGYGDYGEFSNDVAPNSENKRKAKSTKKPKENTKKKKRKSKKKKSKLESSEHGVHSSSIDASGITNSRIKADSSLAFTVEEKRSMDNQEGEEKMKPYAADSGVEGVDFLYSMELEAEERSMGHSEKHDLHSTFVNSPQKSMILAPKKLSTDKEGDRTLKPETKQISFAVLGHEISDSNDSIDAHPEYESLTTVSSEIKINAFAHKADSESKKGSSKVNIPLAAEHYMESIKRLQRSQLEYDEELLGKVRTAQEYEEENTEEHLRKEQSSSRKFLNKLFKINKKQ